MYSKRHGLNFLIIVLLLTCITFDIFGQEKPPKKDEVTIPNVGFETYEEVLNILFPVDTIAPLPYGFVLRFKPSFASESQIVVNNNFGNTEVIEYKSLDGNIYEKLNEIYEKTGVNDAEELAKRIRISRRVINTPPLTTKRWREGIYKYLASAGDFESKLIKENMKSVPQAIDGTSYLLWYKGNSNFTFQHDGGTEPHSLISRNENPLVNWMKQIKKEVNKLLSSELNEQLNSKK